MKAIWFLHHGLVEFSGSVSVAEIDWREFNLKNWVWVVFLKVFVGWNQIEKEGTGVVVKGVGINCQL
ncbi:hypothetical protein CsSME_00029803 [Camellia sinensis var. sinensis]